MFLLGLMHPHRRSHLYCSSCFRSFCFSIGLGEASNLILKMHYLIFLNLFFEFFSLVRFCIHSNGIRVLGIPFGFASFSSSFIQKALDEDVHHGNALPKLGDILMIFGIFSKCFAQRSF
jgi:hypothetical protein